MRPLQTLHRNVHGAAERLLAHHKALADWNLAQARLAERYVQDLLVMARTSSEITAQAVQGMGRVIVDAMAPRADHTPERPVEG
jgi:hypothetical protein